MSDSRSASTQPLAAALDACRRHYKLWVGCTLAFTLAGLLYASQRRPTWRATQSLLVREEVGEGFTKPGRFDTSDAMKTAQETIVQVAHNPAMVEAALRDAGPPEQRTAADEYPNSSEIEATKGAIVVSPPKGGEFGKNEVIVLSIQAESPTRAVQLVQAIAGQLDAHVRLLRDQKAQSIVTELEQAVGLARADLDAATARLEVTERDVGHDLGELRTLNDAGAGDSNLRSAFNEINEELRNVRTLHESNSEVLRILNEAGDDPSRLQAAPARVFDTQPGLRRFKEGLVDAQLRVAQLSARLGDEHPDLKAARAAEAEVRRQLELERAQIVRNLEADLEVSAATLRSREGQLADVQARMNRLAGLRARYSNEVASVRQRSESLLAAEQDLSNARASQAAAGATSVLTKVDEALADRRPVGPGGLQTVASAATCGLILGLALVFLAPPDQVSWGRRIGDLARFGRRASDVKLKAGENGGERRATVRGRRASDATAPTSTANDPAAQVLEIGALALHENADAKDASGNPHADDRRQQR